MRFHLETLALHLALQPQPLLDCISLKLCRSKTEHARLLDKHHALVALAKDGPIQAPLSSPNLILDIGCGPGIVTRYLSSHFPAAEHVYGIDLCLTPAEPEDSTLANLAFIRGDFRKIAGVDPRLPYGSADYVYSRLLICGMTEWPGYVRQALKMLKPGGWAEMGDYVERVYYTDMRLVAHEDWEWLRSIRTGGAKQGLDLDAGLNIPRYMEDAGFVDVQTWEHRIPFWRSAAVERPETKAITEHSIGDPWGLYWHMLPKLLSGMDYTEGDIQRLRTDMRKDLAEEEGKYQKFCVTIGRKPDL